eukprot:CAMPEP_0197626128 /NCGR_PEP_ID=MMETSP1338-20131121/5243_1 /TAXON_ID=43686 ORGANISM="Pelagodinium beii, Strain RCC1491" /NCGR_SAMPLE_ID=MMETSP1338 /ASSEMBLY_ACC=CAM_ASM_000754 /LENGTH=106 /DNA_ID=CAMNT_0043196647 /DNA_START=57 /DNA_END=377 /DNA_ORIENTATION=+
MASRALSQTVARSKKIWMGQTETWPVIASVGFACGVCAFYSSKCLFTSPAVHWDRSDRSTAMRDNFAEGKRWIAHREGIRAGNERVANTSTIGFRNINRIIGGGDN